MRKRRYPDPCGIQCAKPPQSTRTVNLSCSRVLQTAFWAHHTALWLSGLNALRQLNQDSFQESGISTKKHHSSRSTEYPSPETNLYAANWSPVQCNAVSMLLHG